MIDFLTLVTSDMQFSGLLRGAADDSGITECFKDRSSKTHGIVHVFQLSGAKARMLILNDYALLGRHRDKYTITRIDVARDFEVFGYAPLLGDGFEKMLTTTYQARGAITGFTFGSRRSTRYLRVYNSGVKHGFEVPMWRVEFELKDKRVLAGVLGDNPLGWHSQAWAHALNARVASVLSDYARSPLESFASYATDYGVVDSDGVVDGDVLDLTWLKTVVVPYVRRLFAQHGDTAIQVVLPILIELVEYARRKR